ncbi:MAG: fibrillarin-like rRNA/tRNA 2'-O-methyltransferase [Methanolinea sp.]|jgi:fibrillarin-like pre-rRNA processing protein|nr:fibrillarin-like rRNA/tRNA 2'-O-methyltransferase [Methanolinea sp.]
MIWIDGVLVSRGEGGVYGERMIRGHRVWDPCRSKLAAYYYLGGEVSLEPWMRVLYLGAAHGTTVSHVSDSAEVVYAVENAYAPMRDLLAVASRRKNIIPLFADAAHPSSYAPLVEEVDLLFQDVAHPDQAGIALMNLPFLRRGGTALIVVKARSIDVTQKPADVVHEVSQKLAESGLISRRVIWLEPYHRDHAILECPKD